MNYLRSNKACLRLCLTGLLLSLSPSASQACSVCYGEPDSPAAKGLAWAIIALALIVGVVLSGVVAFFVHAGRAETEREGLE